MIDSARLRAELERILADQTHAVRDLAQQVAGETWRRVEAGAPAAQAVRDAMAAAGVDEALQQRLGRDVVQSLCAGAGILPQVTAAGLIDQFAASALVLSWDSSGMPLSSRLHSAQVQRDVAHVISSAISRRDDAWRTARRIYDGYGFGGALKAQALDALPKDLQDLVDTSRRALRPQDVPGFLASAKEVKRYAQALRTAPLRVSYLRLLDQLEKGLAKGIERAVRVATEEKTRYFAERILRTESARAWGEGFFDQVERDPDATGLRWETSSAHRIFDVCDFNHRADLFGMGPGVYPKEHRPSYPAHPHCLCVLSAWYKPAGREQIDGGGRLALKAMSESERARLLGIRGAEAFAQNGQWRGGLRNWTAPAGAGQSQGAKKILAAVRGALPAAQGAFATPGSVREAAEAIEALGVKAEISGMSLDHAQDVSRAVHHIVVTHGLPPPLGVRFVRSISGGRIFMADSPNTDATIQIGFQAATPGEWIRERKERNDAAAMERAAWMALDNQGRREHLRRGLPIPAPRAYVSETVFDTVIHEYGHYLHSLTYGRNQFATEKAVTGFKELSGRDPTDAPIMSRRRAVGTKKIQALARETLSEYSTTNVLETFAEAFSTKYSKGRKLPERFERVVNDVVKHARPSP